MSVSNLLNTIFKQYLPCGGISQFLGTAEMQNKILDIYTQAFTHPSFHVTNNYQVYEQIGDLSINKFFVW